MRLGEQPAGEAQTSLQCQPRRVELSAARGKQSPVGKVGSVHTGWGGVEATWLIVLDRKAADGRTCLSRV